MPDITSAHPGVERRLTERGLTLPQVAAPTAAYLPAVTDGTHVYTSGQLPLVDGALKLIGKVGSDVAPDQARACALICALNALAAIRAEIGDLDRITRIVKVTGFVASDPSFTGQPQVVNGASELLGWCFGPVGAHARSAIGVAALPLDSPVEIEITATFN
ncbi:RidA family protein [Mycobacterium shigaense]|uniref:LysR family transcriptional regulator n=1 Tax=Mycobacterium shigaense TaxID=722731 RepID=A0A1Z4EPI0_9MYCO|nr:RidA family protein [Mycobacterium shigaense]MEA1121741.1 RidA family protein [Mycobacterium shigaense]PRI15023.1 LysR family transcriptional regulator [Mycobacterium shigaense]BAX94851.1 LysR family transcriptional regulator [Mycobacterium shigaense]